MFKETPFKFLFFFILKIYNQINLFFKIYRYLPQVACWEELSRFYVQSQLMLSRCLVEWMIILDLQFKSIRHRLKRAYKDKIRVADKQWPQIRHLKENQGIMSSSNKALKLWLQGCLIWTRLFQSLSLDSYLLYLWSRQGLLKFFKFKNLKIFKISNITNFCFSIIIYHFNLLFS